MLRGLMRLDGRVLSDRYRLVAQLGRGGMGSVWRAEHIELGTPAAIKLIDPRIADDEQALARFKREAQAAATLRSPHVVQILDYGVDAGMPFIAMELLDGDSLAYRMQQEGTLLPVDTAIIITHVARAVGKAHAIGIVHRDLKPDNIFIVHNEDEEIVKVLDFGIAKKTDDAAAQVTAAPNTDTGKMLGTPFYMSPEQAGGKKSVDHRTDIWAMAVIACECLTGKRPFDSDMLGGLVLAICMDPMPVPSKLGPVPAGFDEWFAKAAHRDPDQRHESAQACAADLRAVCGIGDRVGLRGASAAEIEIAPGSTRTNLALGIDESADTEAQSPLGVTAQQATPTSITVGGLDRSGRARTHKLAAGVIAAIVLAGVVVAYALRAGSGDANVAATAPHPSTPEVAAIAESAEPEADPQPSASAPAPSEPVVTAVSASAAAEDEPAPDPSPRSRASRPAAAPAPAKRPTATGKPAPVPVGDDLDLAF